MRAARWCRGWAGRRWWRRRLCCGELASTPPQLTCVGPTCGAARTPVLRRTGPLWGPTLRPQTKDLRLSARKVWNLLASRCGLWRARTYERRQVRYHARQNQSTWPGHVGHTRRRRHTRCMTPRFVRVWLCIPASVYAHESTRCPNLGAGVGLEDHRLDGPGVCDSRGRPGSPLQVSTHNTAWW